MKKHSFLAGMLTMALIVGLGMSALAATGSFTITVDPVNIQVNGTTFAPKDAKGNDVPVFAYGGTTYAPLRALAEAYGLEVGYDAASNMATVGEAATTTPTPVDPNHEPEITADDLKLAFRFDQIRKFEGHEIDQYEFKYSGEKPIDEYISWWRTLNHDDVSAAMSAWAKDLYETEHEGNRDLRLLLCGNVNGAPFRFAEIIYSPKGAGSFFFDDWFA